jgi:hypothetical protein
VGAKQLGNTEKVFRERYSHPRDELAFDLIRELDVLTPPDATSPPDSPEPDTDRTQQVGEVA